VRLVMGLDIKHGATIAPARGFPLAPGVAITSGDSRGPPSANGSRGWQIRGDPVYLRTASALYVRKAGCVDALVRDSCGSHTNQGTYPTWGDGAEAKFDMP
jgi:hypothetical protein